MTDNDKKDLALAAWVLSIEEWTKEATRIIEELDDRLNKLEGHEVRYREGRVEERIAALEQIYNKSKQAPETGLFSSYMEDHKYTNCLCKVCSPPKADPGPGFYYCPSCGTRQITGSFHYCAGKTYPPEGFGHGSAATYMTGCGQGGEAPHFVNLPDPYKGAQEVPDVPHPARGGAAMEGGQRGAAPLCGPESAPVPWPPLGGQTEEEIRKAAQRAKLTSPWTVWSYRVDY